VLQRIRGFETSRVYQQVEIQEHEPIVSSFFANGADFYCSEAYLFDIKSILFNANKVGDRPYVTTIIEKAEG